MPDITLLVYYIFSEDHLFYFRKESSESEAKKLKTSDDGVDATDFRFSALLEESVTEESCIALLYRLFYAESY